VLQLSFNKAMQDTKQQKATIDKLES